MDLRVFFVTALVASLAVGTPVAQATLVTRLVSDYKEFTSTEPAFFHGALLTEHDLDQEQSYETSKKRLLDPTETSLTELFESAGTASALLFFDEADALLGKRTEVSDANDRFGDDFILLFTDDSDNRWLGHLFIGGIDGIADGVYDLSGTFALITEPATLALLAPALLLGWVRARRLASPPRRRAP